MDWILWFFRGIWMVLAFLSMGNALLSPLLRRRQDRDLAQVSAGRERPVFLVAPVKGFEEGITPAFFSALMNQDYSRYRVAVAFESEEDPACEWLKCELGLGPGSGDWEPEPGGRTADGLERLSVVIAGPCERRGQKVHNQLAALALLEDADEIVAFADGDIRCRPDWLRRLAAPINGGKREASTTYRWLVPERPTLPNLCASVMNASAATLGGLEAWTMFWGGSMALSRRLFEEMDVPRVMDGVLSDDLRLSKVIRTAGHRIAFVRSLIVPSPVDHTWGSLFEFGRRQYFMIRNYTPIFYRGLSLLIWGYVLGLASSVMGLFSGEPWGWLPVAFVFLCDQGRALGRRRIYRGLYRDSPEVIAALRRTAWVEHLATPLWMIFHWFIVVSSLFVRRIRWAGIEYRVRSWEETEVIRGDS